MDLSRAIFIGTSVVVVLAIVFGLGLYSGYSRNPAFNLIQGAKNSIVNSISAVRETSVNVPKNHLGPARHSGEGVTVNSRPDDGSLILLSGFFEDNNELRLVRRDGSIVNRWPVKFSELFPETDFLREVPATDWNVDLHGALITPDGSAVFNFEYSGLVKLDRCGSTDWTLKQATHHSVEQADDGTYWVPGQRYVESGESPFRPFRTPYKEDVLFNVSSEGEIISEFSVPAILYDNGLGALLTATGEKLRTEDFGWDGELVHTNKLGVLSSDMAPAFRKFKTGDLILSIRELNLVLVFDPESRQIRWWQIGPWLRQHDPEFNGDGTITVYNNNTFMLDQRLKGRQSNIIRVDPENGESQVIFGERPGEEFRSVIRGKHDVLANGGLLITEFEAGRVIETDASGKVVWEYINRYDEDRIAEVTEARLYSEDYFTVTDWSCPSPN